ncbi:MAG TPA: ZIP family metal transporter [Rhizomicrobium sp.]|jgi:zinc transporter ZupT|nr:ZIP family metal transporter [Rhizomicrobium sp.]
MNTPLLVMTISLGAFTATMLGGLFAMALRDRLHLVLGFSAGAVIGVAFFDLMPEALATGASWGSRNILLLCALGFFVYTIIDRLMLLHEHGDEHHSSEARGWIGAGSFSAHSFLDGFAIGIAFQASRAVGIIVAIAVLVHDFSDGLNTVNVVVKNGGDRRIAVRWLILDAAAPVIGAGASLLVRLPESDLALILAMFSGFFLYIGASDLLPESHHAHPRFLTTVATLLGAGTLLFATQFVG